jgi:hypothetical protein
MAGPVIDIAAQFTGNKAFKQAETATQKLEKSVGKLGKQLLGVFAASKLLAFGKQAAKAFAADEKAARSLALALANTGNAFAGIEVEKFIADLQRATGVLDDNLRPAFRTLLTATGDVKKSQDALALALDISAGTGRDLSQVTLALARGFTGQTTGLSRLGAGLTKATLATGDMDAIVGQLSDKFRGQALAAAEGYAGSMARLTVASENAKEIIGKDLLDAMQLIAGEEGIGGATTAMEGFATQIGNVIYGIGVLTAKLNSLPILKDVFGAFADVSKYNIIGLLGQLGSSTRARNAGTPAQSPAERMAIDKAAKDAIKLQKTQNTLKKIDNDNTTRKLVLSGDQLALLELEKKFDVERIGLYAALNQSTDGETKMRLLSLIAIHDQNEALAGMIKKATETGDAFGSLTETLRSIIRNMLDSISGPLAALQKLLGMQFSSGNNNSFSDVPSGFSVFDGGADGYQGFGSGMSNLGQNNYGGIAGAGMYGGGGAPVVYNINASGIGDQQIAAVVQGAIQDLNRYGSSTTYAGAI